MGAGKTTVGTRCAERLDRPFVDTDDIVTALAGMPVPDLFATGGGEPAFRALERQAVDDVCASPQPLVIATGGGAVLDPENRRQLRTTGFVIWLRGTPEVLAARVGSGTDRPLLAGDPQGALARLGAQREPAYEAAADHAVDTTDRDIDEVVEDVLVAFEERS
jgi:shikimate kinase